MRRIQPHGILTIQYISTLVILPGIDYGKTCKPGKATQVIIESTREMVYHILKNDMLKVEGEEETHTCGMDQLCVRLIVGI